MLHSFPEDLKKTAFKAVEVANKITLEFFRKTLVISNKNEQSFDPVTLADTQAEQAIREIIAHDFPTHGIIGEEFLEVKAQSSDYQWIIDPIDGTRAYITGLPMWGTLIGVLYQGKPIFGAMSQPVVGDLFYGDGQTSFLKNFSGEKKIETRSVNSINDATMFCTTPDMFMSSNYSDSFHKLRQACKTVRYGTDCYGYMAVAAGWGDIVFEADLKPVDIIPLVPIIKGAGGVISDLGFDGFKSETILVASSQNLFDKAHHLIRLVS